jgi:hypothetical protein
MSFSTKHSLFFVLLALFTCCSIVMAGCGQAILSHPDSGAGEDGAFDEIDLSDSSGDVDGGGDAEDGSGEEADLPADDSGLEPVALACPKEVTEFVLFVSHNWNFSPNRELEKMRIDGQTSASSPCPFSVAGSTVVMEQCKVPITNTGFIQTDEGPCDITSSGQALVSIEDASCKDGVITMTIVESINPDVGDGAMNCPGMSEPYFPLFPFSRTTRSFPIRVGGSEATEMMDPDLSAQFMYNKTWSVHAEGMDFPLPDD